VNRFTVGLTGGIGSGKSAVAKLFGELGIDIIDSDVIAHELTRPGGAAIAPIRAAFGAEVIGPDGALDRVQMRRRVFERAEERKCLEAILHPLIREHSRRAAELATSDYVILVVPLLIESGVDRDRYQRILVVDCPESVQVERVMRRSGLTENEVLGIMATQATRDQRLARADDVIDNSGAPEILVPQVRCLHGNYATFAATYYARS
jgi:dephospho-CoA kinase